MLSQSLYLGQITSDKDGWFYKTAQDWYLETSLTLREQQSARRALRNCPFWCEERRGPNGILHFRVDHGLLLESLQSLFGTDKLSIPVCAKARERIRRSDCSGFRKRGKHYKEAEITSENVPWTTSEIEKSNTPTPLQVRENGQEAHNWDHLLKLFWLTIKSDLMTGPFLSKNLEDDWDLYFRDMWIIEWREDVVYLGAKDPDAAQRGLSKYEKRMKQTFFATTGRRAERFKLVVPPPQRVLPLAPGRE